MEVIERVKVFVFVFGLCLNYCFSFLLRVRLKECWEIRALISVVL